MTDPKATFYYEVIDIWRAEQAALRAILLETELTETYKWKQPCYTFGGANLVMVAALKDAATLSFLKGALIPDPEAVLIRPGPNSRSARYMKFGSVDEIAARAGLIRAYVDAAIAAERQGLKVSFTPDDLAFPEELTARLDADPGFLAAWEALTPGRRRSYVLNIAQAKRSATRAARVEKWAPRILAGRGIHDR